MDVNAIRKDLAQYGRDNGYEAVEYVPEGLAFAAAKPTWVIGVPTEVSYDKSLGLGRVQLPVTVSVPIGTFQDAQASLDAAVSTSVAGSVVDLFRVQPTSDHWRQIHVLSAGNVRFSDDEDAKVLAADIVLEILARLR